MMIGGSVAVAVAVPVGVGGGGGGTGVFVGGGGGTGVLVGGGTGMFVGGGTGVLVAVGSSDCVVDVGTVAGMGRVTVAVASSGSGESTADTVGVSSGGSSPELAGCSVGVIRAVAVESPSSVVGSSGVPTTTDSLGSSSRTIVSCAAARISRPNVNNGQSAKSVMRMRKPMREPALDHVCSGMNGAEGNRYLAGYRWTRAVDAGVVARVRQRGRAYSNCLTLAQHGLTLRHRFAYQADWLVPA
jgi:hypothetical protein